MKKYNMFEKIVNWIERTPGYSWCKHCGKTWNKVEPKTIPYKAKTPDFSGSGMFPLCTKCFNELSSDEIYTYCHDLANEWKKNNTITDIDLNIINHNIRYMKEHRRELKE